MPVVTFLILSPNGLIVSWALLMSRIVPNTAPEVSSVAFDGVSAPATSRPRSRTLSRPTAFSAHALPFSGCVLQLRRRQRLPLLLIVVA